jgi:hypothetical protein
VNELNFGNFSLMKIFLYSFEFSATLLPASNDAQCYNPGYHCFLQHGGIIVSLISPSYLD